MCMNEICTAGSLTCHAGMSIVDSFGRSEKLQNVVSHPNLIMFQRQNITAKFNSLS